MESSEDDAGNATSASRRVSAREKDFEQAENVDATSCYHQEPCEARTSCGTPAMSEDNFDGDSVPSPSAQDVNTSTEAILDMIDEIVDGPGAPKRIPLSIRTFDTDSSETSVAVSDRSDPEQDPSKPDNVDIPLLPKLSLVGDGKSDNQNNATQTRVQLDFSSCNMSTGTAIIDSAASTLPCVVEPENNPSVSALPESNCLVSSMESEPSTSCSLSNIPSSNIIQDVQNSLDISDSEKMERTIKCVSSSDKRDSVIVESAESTSSDCSLSESKTICAEFTTRSPLKRRLVRPSPSDRRPDSTVSSTADSQHIDLNTSKPISSENIVKDVSSSSDAIPPLQGSGKPEEIRDISEISICKAETSVSPPKKIKLIRPKVLPCVYKNDVIVDKQIPSTSSQCESTVSDNISTCYVEHMPNISTCVSSQKSKVDTKTQSPKVMVKSDLCTENTSKETTEPKLPDMPISKHDHKIDKEIECAGPSLLVPTLLPTAEKDLTSFKETREVDNRIINIEVVKENSNEISTKTSETIESIITSSIESSKIHIEPLKIPEVANASELKNKMDLVMAPCNVPSNSSTECEIEQKKPPTELNPLQLSDTSQEKKSEEQHSDMSQVLQVPESSNFKSILKPVNEANINTSDCYKDLEKKVPLIKSNLCQLSDTSQDTTSEQVDQLSNKPDIPESTNSESKLKPVIWPSSNSLDCLQEAEKKVPPIKLNLFHHSDIPPKRIDDEYKVQPFNILNVSSMITEPSNNESKIKSVNEANSSTSSECFQSLEKKVPPIKLNISLLSDTIESVNVISEPPSSTNKGNSTEDEQESVKQVPKLTIKLLNKTLEEVKSPIPKLTIKPIKPPPEKESSDRVDNNQQIVSVTKINIKAIPKPSEKNDTPTQNIETREAVMESEPIPTVTKLNIKPILKPPEKINDFHRKSSSSEISESECSENDESTSTSDQASASDNATSEVVPKVTIKLGKPGTESEGKFYTEQNVPKLTIKGLPYPEKEEQESVSKLKVVISQSEDNQIEKIPKLTIKTVPKSESQPLSPKLTIKPLKPPDISGKEPEIPKLKIITETLSSKADPKENVHVPKITIKPITKQDIDTPSKTSKKSGSVDSPEQIPVITKLNIKPVLKPTQIAESSESIEDKVLVVSKLNIKPVTKPKDNEVDSSIEDVPKVTKLNIKPLKDPEVNASEQKDCDEMNAVIDKNSIPVITKINIKPIVKPLDKERTKSSENQSPETGNSSDENPDIPVVTKLNIKPILKPLVLEEVSKTIMCNEPSLPVVTKLNIKPLVKPDECTSPSSPKKDSLKSPGSHSPTIPVVTKLNIKPLVKPDENDKLKEEHVDKPIKNPPLVMKINMKTVTDSIINEICSTSAYSSNSLKDNGDVKLKTDIKTENHCEVGIQRISSDKAKTLSTVDCMMLRSTRHVSAQENVILEHTNMQNCLSNIDQASISKKHDNVTNPIGSPKLEDSQSATPIDIEQSSATSLLNKAGQKDVIKSGELQGSEMLRKNSRATLQYCTLLKKLLENPKDDLGRKSNELKDSIKVDGILKERLKSSPTSLIDNVNCELNLTMKSDKRYMLDNTINSEKLNEETKRKSPSPDKINDINIPSSVVQPLKNVSKTVNESITKPLEISITEKNTNQSSGQDSPRIILKINKTDHGSSSKIITEDVKNLEVIQNDTTQQLVNDKPSPKKQLDNSRKKGNTDLGFQNILAISTRLRSSRKLDNVEISPAVKQSSGKRPSSTEPSPSHNRENEISVLDAKRLKLGQILSNNAMISQSVTITPVVAKVAQPSQIKPSLEIRRGGKLINHTILNNENCSKNGNSKLHNILSNLHTKQIHPLPFNDINCSEKTQSTSSEMDSNASTGSSEVAENISSETQPIEVQEMLINENSDFQDLSVVSEELSQDPLEPENQTVEEPTNGRKTPHPVETTPQPKKRGRPRKLPVTESPKPTIVTLPVSALEERPQRSLRLTRERPVIVPKPRGGRGRGRGARRGSTSQAHTPQKQPERVPTPPATSPSPPPASPTPIDPTSSRIKLPRMTEALDKMPSSGSTPHSSGSADLNLFSERAELKVVLEPAELDDSFMKSPESIGRPRGGRGSRGGRGRTPRGRGRGRGGGRGAMYMKETMGIYGRVCGPATTTIQLFEEETCMMDDNATPAKPSHLMDEDSQSSVKSSTNESSKMKKSKFADLFDSNKVWTAADVKEYMWPPTARSDMEPQVMMIQEQVAMFLGVKSFKRRYPELKRRTILGDERDFVLAKGLVTEALCELGITAVDASEVLDIMLSDYPHKYEEYRSHQRERQMTESVEDPSAETKSEEKALKVEIKQEKSVDSKPEQPKVDPEKTRQDMAAAAIASASEWNARANASRRPACVDLQSMTVHVRRAWQPRPSVPPPVVVQPPVGFYPHALLPGQYQHWYRHYTPEQLRYFPLNTACVAPPPPLPSTWECSSSSDGEGDGEREGEGSRAGDEDDSDAPKHHMHHNKRKKLTKTKRSSQTDLAKEKEDSRSSTATAEGEVVDTCRACKLRLEANRKYTHERFLVCANCNAKLHPSCVDLSADTIRKCREYAWQCAECKTCNGCQRPADDDKMLFCDLCDRGFHIYCVGLDVVPQGRWHCVECAICKSCGARDPSGAGGGGQTGQGGPTTPSAGGSSEAPPEWHHQTKRGPGGHKCYSHSLCTPCARAYRIGRYCPLCERSFIGPKGTMQLVICKLCDRQLHQECVRQTVSSLNVLDYTCAECRRGGITSRAAAVRLAPRTIATLFMAKRRFNKYAHRQYLASRMAANAANDDTADATDATDTSADALHMDFGD